MWFWIERFSYYIKGEKIDIMNSMILNLTCTLFDIVIKLHAILWHNYLLGQLTMAVKL